MEVEGYSLAHIFSSSRSSIYLRFVLVCCGLLSFIHAFILYSTYYSQSESIKRLSAMSGLFGRRDHFSENATDISIVFSGDTEDTKDYAVGLIVLGSLTLAIFLLWSLIIGCCMCCGQHRVGYFSGRPFMRRGMPPDDDEYDDDEYDDDDDEYDDSQVEESMRSSSKNRDDFDDDYSHSHRNSEHPLPRKEKQTTSGRRRRWRGRGRRRSSNAAGGDKCCSRPSRIRFFFILCGCVFITFSILMVTEGMTNLQTTVDTMNVTAQNVNALAKEAESVLKISKHRVESLISSLKQRLETDLQPANVQTFCPADPDFTNSNELGKELAEHSATAMEVLQRMETEFVDNAEWSQIGDTLTSMQEGSQSVSDTLEPIETTDWQALIVLIPYTVVPALLIAATIMSYFDVKMAWFSCLVNWFLVPVFILMTWFMCIFTSVMAITAGVNSDFCLPGGNVETASPDEAVTKIMEQQGFGPETMEYKVSKYYIDKCIDPANDPLTEVKSYLEYIRSKESAIQQLADQLTDESNVAQLSLHCNRNFDGVDLLLDNVLDLFRLTLASVQRIMDLLSCERIVPLYTTSVYQGTCEYSSKAVYWMYCSALVMAVMGMLMITLRASYKLSKYDHDPDYEPADKYYGDKDEKRHDRSNNDASGYDDDYDDHDDYQGNTTNRGSQHYDDDFDDGIQDLPPPPAAASNQPRGTRPARDDDFDRQHHHDGDAVSAYPDATSRLPAEEAALNRNRSPHHDRPKHHDVGAYDDSGSRGGRVPSPTQYKRFETNTQHASLADSSGTEHFSVSSNHDDDVTFDDGDFNDDNNVYAGKNSGNRRMSGMSEDPPEGADYR
jgi:hypothetical protein